jgi:hypothetical protein
MLKIGASFQSQPKGFRLLCCALHRASGVADLSYSVVASLLSRSGIYLPTGKNDFAVSLVSKFRKQPVHISCRGFEFFWR